jgi:hypothetical protein
MSLREHSPDPLVGQAEPSDGPAASESAGGQIESENAGSESSTPATEEMSSGAAFRVVHWRDHGSRAVLALALLLLLMAVVFRVELERGKRNI